MVLALELEPSFREQARKNQRAGGRLKRSTNLSEAEVIDCRKEIAKQARVSSSYVGKVKQLLAANDPDLLQALREETVTINCGIAWLSIQNKQRCEFKTFMSQVLTKKKVSALIRPHRQRSLPTRAINPKSLGLALSHISPDQAASIPVTVLERDGPGVFITCETMRLLESQGGAKL